METRPSITGIDMSRMVSRGLHRGSGRIGSPMRTKLNCWLDAMYFSKAINPLVAVS